MLPASRSASRSSSERRRKSRSASSSRSQLCSLTSARPAPGDEHFVVGGRGAGAARGSSAAARARGPHAPTISDDDRDAPRDQREAVVAGVQQDALAVDARRTRARISASLWPCVDAVADVVPDRPRLRRVALGHRLAGAHRARELALEPAGARFVGESDGCDRATSTTTATATMTAQRDPRRIQRRIRASLAPRAASARGCRRVTAANCSPATRPSGAITNVSGWPVVPYASAALLFGSKRDRPADVLVVDVVARRLRSVSSRTMPTIAKSGSSLCRS